MNAPRPSPARSARRLSRQVALQGLYQWLLTGDDAASIDAHLREQPGYAKCDQKHLDLLMQGCIREAAALDALLSSHVDRPTKDLSPVEHGVLLLGAFELRECVDIPYRVVINESVELAKSFGGTDGHKYVNGVLDRLAGDLRRVEIEAARAKK
ncbi:MAG: transcription antitermination factor NusB [Burkholderiales bacterium]